MKKDTLHEKYNDSLDKVDVGSTESTFVKFLSNSPLVGADVDFERDKSFCRKT